jgi:predicted SprT family Zn-dependent metalloprotease
MTHGDADLVEIIRALCTISCAARSLDGRDNDADKDCHDSYNDNQLGQRKSDTSLSETAYRCVPCVRHLMHSTFAAL